MRNKISGLLGAATVASVLAIGSTSAGAADISGAGATFPYPIYAKWADSYKKETGNGLNYQSIGSGGRGRGLEILRLGLRPGRPDGRSPRLRNDAGKRQIGRASCREIV